MAGYSVAQVKSIIVAVAKHYGIDPYLALAAAKQESGWRYNAVGDNGSSFGIYQLHRGGELGSLSPTQAFDPHTNAMVALKRFAEVKKAHPNWSPGQIAAAAQRPANQAAYARSVDAIYAQLKGTKIPNPPAATGPATVTPPGSGSASHAPGATPSATPEISASQVYAQADAQSANFFNPLNPNGILNPLGPLGSAGAGAIGDLIKGQGLTGTINSATQVLLAPIRDFFAIEEKILWLFLPGSLLRVGAGIFGIALIIMGAIFIGKEAA